MVYREARRTVALQDGTARKVEALVYLVDRHHEHYAGKLPLETQLEIVRRSRGKSGDNQDYVLSTARHLLETGVRDHGLEWLARGLTGGAAHAEDTSAISGHSR